MLFYIKQLSFLGMCTVNHLYILPSDNLYPHTMQNNANTKWFFDYLYVLNNLC